MGIELQTLTLLRNSFRCTNLNAADRRLRARSPGTESASEDISKLQHVGSKSRSSLFLKLSLASSHSSWSLYIMNRWDLNVDPQIPQSSLSGPHEAPLISGPVYIGPYRDPLLYLFPSPHRPPATLAARHHHRNRCPNNRCLRLSGSRCLRFRDWEKFKILSPGSPYEGLNYFGCILGETPRFLEIPAWS